MNVNEKEVIRYLEDSGEFLQNYPSCSYIVCEVINLIRELEDVEDNKKVLCTLNNFADFLEGIWKSSTSTVSSGIPWKLQADFVKKLSDYILEMANLVKDCDSYCLSETKWKKEFNEFWKEKLRKSLWDVKIKRNERTDIDYERLEIDAKRLGIDLKYLKTLVEILNDYRLFFVYDKPVFILRSGFRSSNFINLFYLISPMNLEEEAFEKSEKTAKLLREFFSDISIEPWNGKKLVPLVFQKRAGEDPGTVAFSKILTNFKLPYFVMDLDTEYSWFKGPMMKSNPDLREVEVIPIVDITTTGGTLNNIIEEYEQIVGKKPKLCLNFFNRLGYSSWNGTKIISFSKLDVVPNHLKITPDICTVSISEKDDYLNYLWPSLFLFHNHIHDVLGFGANYLTEKTYTSYLEECNSVVKDIKEYITNSYRLKEKDERAYLFEKYNTNKNFKEITNYLMNIHFLCWRHMFYQIFMNEEAVTKRPIEFLKDSLEFDKSKEITIPYLPNLLENELENSKFSSLTQPWDVIHRIFIINTDNIITELNKRVRDTFYEEDPPWGAVITREQAEAIVERKLKSLYGGLKASYEGKWEHPEYKPTGGKKVYEDYEKWAKKYREYTWEWVKKVYEIVNS